MIILPANTLATGGFEVANSCRFNDGDNPYMYKAGASGNRDTYTFSYWLKRGAITGADMRIGMFSGTDSTSGTTMIWGKFNSDDTFVVVDNTGSGNHLSITTNRKFRDVSSWYHFVVAVDTTQSTEANRCKIYVNGVQETSFSSATYPSQNTDTLMGIGSGYEFVVSGWKGNTNQMFDGYLAEVVHIDGLQLAATSFGEFDEDSPTIWKPIDVSGLTFGTNGFYLDFEDSANLGNDANGGTDLTEANLAAADQCKDSPTNSFCTMNPLNNYYPGGTLSEGNTNVVTGSSSYTFLTGTIGVSTGKWYYEAKIIDEGTHANVGIATKPPYTTNIYPGFEPNDYFYKSTDGNSYTSDAGSSYGNTYTTNDIIGVYIDLDNSKLYFAKNGTVQNSGTGISITTPAAASIDFSSESGQPGSGFYFPAVGDYSGSDTSTFALNFGNGQFAGTAVSSGNADANGYGNFEYDPSSGTFDSASKNFLAICTKNLAEHG